MSWGGGTWVARGLMEAGQAILSPSLRMELYLRMIPVLEGMDWDNHREVMGEDLVFDEAVHLLHPKWRD